MAEKVKIGDELGSVGFTMGILSIVFSGIVGILLGVIGAIFCAIQQKRHKIKIAKIGLILNIVGIVLSIAFIALYSYLAPLLSQYTQSLS